MQGKSEQGTRMGQKRGGEKKGQSHHNSHTDTNRRGRVKSQVRVEDEVRSLSWAFDPT